MKIEWTPAALADRDAIFDYIEADSPRAAVAVDERIEAAVERLADFPESGRPGRVAGTRELVMTRAPYVLPYGIAGDTCASFAFCMVRVSGRMRFRTTFSAQDYPPFANTECGGDFNTSTEHTDDAWRRLMDHPLQPPFACPTQAFSSPSPAPGFPHMRSWPRVPLHARPQPITASLDG